MEMVSAANISDPTVQKTMRELLISKPDDTDETRLKKVQDFFSLYKQHAGQFKKPIKPIKIDPNDPYKYLDDSHKTRAKSAEKAAKLIKKAKKEGPYFK
jgi:CO dehydrogenase/acetyl-CoA synthase alpha subunit